MGWSLPIVYFQSAFILRNSVFWWVNTIIMEKKKQIVSIFEGCISTLEMDALQNDDSHQDVLQHRDHSLWPYRCEELQLLYAELRFPKELSFKETEVMGYNYLHFSEDYDRIRNATAYSFCSLLWRTVTACSWNHLSISKQQTSLRFAASAKSRGLTSTTKLMSLYWKIHYSLSSVKWSVHRVEILLWGIRKGLPAWQVRLDQ